jgi:hypothetical protein
MDKAFKKSYIHNQFTDRVSTTPSAIEPNLSLLAALPFEMHTHNEINFFSLMGYKKNQ